MVDEQRAKDFLFEVMKKKRPRVQVRIHVARSAVGGLRVTQHRTELLSVELAGLVIAVSARTWKRQEVDADPSRGLQPLRRGLFIRFASHSSYGGIGFELPSVLSGCTECTENAVKIEVGESCVSC